MGEVYRARDTKLGRDVALKILPEAFLLDPDRLARFKREAQVLASLNHPNIAAIHGLEESTGTQVLVLELVEGPTLADRIARGPIPLDEALPVARQIADALEAAHEHGIVHRDIKPSNIKVKSDGTVKVLDFGLAKALDDAPGSDVSRPSLTASPTLTSPAATRVGIILGTAAYMSPEQARGKSVDKRADIWAFGCVLYEMLTGRPAFEGEEVSDVLARVIEREPDLTRLPAKTPPSIRRLLRRCLEKDRKRRLADAADVRLEIDEASAPLADAGVTQIPEKYGRTGLAWSAAAILGLIAAVAVAVALRSAARQLPLAPVVRSSVLPPDDASFVLDANIGGSAISPDGRQLAFVAESGDKSILYVRALDSLSVRALPGTEDAARPFWSPDSRNVGFYARGHLHRIGLDEGAPRPICDVSLPRGATWSEDGTIVFSTGRPGALSRVPASGGTPTPVTTLEEPGVLHYWPQFLPDGRHFLYLVRYLQADKSAIYVGSLDDSPNQTKRVRLVPSMVGAVFSARPEDSRRGHLLFFQGSILMAQALDVLGLTLTGDPEPIAQNTGGSPSNAYADISASRTGAIAYGNVNQGLLRFVWLDRDGKRSEIAGVESNRSLGQARISPNGASIVFRRDSDLWRLDPARSAPTRMTFTSAAYDPTWSPDGGEIVYRDLASIYRMQATGSGAAQKLAPLDTEPGTQVLLDWSDDGKFLLYQLRHSPGQFTVSALPLLPDGTAGTPIPFITFNARLGSGGPVFARPRNSAMGCVRLRGAGQTASLRAGLSSRAPEVSNFADWRPSSGLEQGWQRTVFRDRNRDDVRGSQDRWPEFRIRPAKAAVRPASRNAVWPAPFRRRPIRATLPFRGVGLRTGARIHLDHTRPELAGFAETVVAHS